MPVAFMNYIIDTAQHYSGQRAATTISVPTCDASQYLQQTPHLNNAHGTFAHQAWKHNFTWQLQNETSYCDAP